MGNLKKPRFFPSRTGNPISEVPASPDSQVFIGEAMDLPTVQTLTEKYILNTYNKYPIAFRFGVGELLYDLDNKEYIDFQSGIAVTNLGHGEADIIEALRDQADRLIHTSNLYFSEEQVKLAEVIIENSFEGKVFFCNSGTEANEAAFKLMRRHGLNKKISKPIILALEGSFHGRTTAAMTLTGQASVHDGFGDLLPDVHHVTPNDEESLVDAFDSYGENIAGFIIEPIQGESGVIPITQSFANLARKYTHETKSILIFDEIQTGMGRTGKLFAFEHFGFRPDAMTLAKAMGSGFPMGALVVAQNYADVLGRGLHGSTFGGNHLACAVAYETFKIILGRDLLSEVGHISNHFFSRLQSMKTKHPIIQEVRGKGLHIGVELSEPSRPIVEECLKRGLVLNSTANTVLRFMPPLTIRLEIADKGLDILESVLKDKA